jgi:enhancing lycopene biosynthesis protein 2
MPAKVGVILCGCGYLDGSEITEAVSVLIALDKRGASIECFAPDAAQSDVVNHAAKKPEPSSRNMLQEAARIARSKIRDLSQANASDLDALIIPGGFGAAKNLCDFASKGANCTVRPDVAKFLQQMHAAKKPIGLACIAPVLAAAVFGKMNVKPTITIGTDKGVADAIHTMGGVHQNTDPAGICIDQINKLVTTPCYMNDVGAYTVFQGADKMVEAVLKLARAR